MKKDLSKYLEREEKGEMSEDDIRAKMDVLQELLEMASGAAGDSIKDGLQKMTISAPDKEGTLQ